MDVYKTTIKGLNIFNLRVCVTGSHAYLSYC